MTRRKSHKENIRKISRIGNASLGITLPISFLRALKWKEKQRVVVEKRGKKLIIRDFDPKKG